MSRCQHEEDGEGIKKDDRAADVATQVNESDELCDIQRREVIVDQILERLNHPGNALKQGRDDGADQQGPRHRKDHQEIFQRHLPPRQAACPPGMVDGEHQGMEELQRRPDQDQDRDDADAAAGFFQSMNHAPEKILLIIPERHEAMDCFNHRVRRKEVGAQRQQKRHERHEREDGVVGEGGRTLLTVDAGVDGEGLLEKPPGEDGPLFDLFDEHRSVAEGD